MDHLSLYKSPRELHLDTIRLFFSGLVERHHPLLFIIGHYIAFTVVASKNKKEIQKP